MLNDTIKMRYSDFVFDKRMKRCPVCGSAKIGRAFRSPKAMNCIEGFGVDACRSCGLSFVNPQPTRDSLAGYYAMADDSMETDLRTVFNKEYQKRFDLEKMGPFRKHVGKGRVLDCGCGIGLFVKALEEQGYESHGIDISSRAVSEGSRRLGLNTLQCSNLDEYRTKKKFDCVTAFAVLEHLKEPVKFVANVAENILKPGGIFAFRIPFGDSLQFKMLGPYFNWLQTPYHLFFFTSRSLEVLLARQGFKILELYQVPVAWHWARNLANSMGLLSRYRCWRKDKNFVRYSMEIDKLFDRIAFEQGKASIIHIYARLAGRRRKGLG